MLLLTGVLVVLAFSGGDPTQVARDRMVDEQLIPRGITVNTVNPGPTDTGWASPDLTEQVRLHAPLGRWGRPEDAARLIAWLATDDAAWITGQVINSTGGF